jgi:hypothetical protein
MKPSLPIIPGLDLPETIYAKDQPEYLPLPVYRQSDGTVLSRWHCTWPERLKILVTGDVYLWQMTFNDLLQPVCVEVQKPEIGSKRNRCELLWGKHKENGVWIAPARQWRFRFLGHDAFYLALGRFRLRIMKPAGLADRFNGVRQK